MNLEITIHESEGSEMSGVRAISVKKEEVVFSGSGMRYGLQYLYTISVFIGVLVTAYLMMNNENTAVASGRVTPPPIALNDVAGIDPTVKQLIEMQFALNSIDFGIHVNEKKR